jgi:glycosyltransferase involved in cell wall biosynthesis
VLIKQHDVVLNFSEAESFSMTCAEAGFYGKPVIASKCGGPEEIIDDGKTGLLVQNKNRQQMEEAMLQLAAALPEDRRMMGAAAKKYVTEKFSTEQFINSFLRVIHG